MLCVLTKNLHTNSWAYFFFFAYSLHLHAYAKSVFLSPCVQGPFYVCQFCILNALDKSVFLTFWPCEVKNLLMCGRKVGILLRQILWVDAPTKLEIRMHFWRRQCLGEVKALQYATINEQSHCQKHIMREGAIAGTQHNKISHVVSTIALDNKKSQSLSKTYLAWHPITC